MRNFLQFAFHFLYERNWHTGQRELSRSRLRLFIICVILVLVALLLIGVLQAPVSVQLVH
jgi:hypothetical protein